MRGMQIMMVARYEALVLSRSVLFRLLVLFGIVGVFLLQYLVQGDNPYSWSMVAYSSSMPLVNAYLYNWVQCFLVVFFAAELPSRERGGGSLEVVHARPEGNGDYFWGKTLGILSVFAGVNAVEVLACMFANALITDIPFNPGIYLFYFLTLTFPSLVFMLGFSVFVAFVSGSRALSLLLSLSLLFLGGGALQSVYRGSADFLGITQARVFSDVTGFPDLGLYLAQRGGVLLTGLGLLFFSACRLGRLPSVAGGDRALLVRGAVLVALGAACVSGYVLAHVREDRVREDYRASFSRYWRQRTCRVSAHELRLRQEESRLDLRSRMTVRNPNGEELPRLTLYLNPGLEVEEVLVDGEPAGFERDNQVLEIGRALSAGDSVEVELAYGGEIDERYCFLDMTDGEYHDASRGDAFFRFGRRYALVDEDCLLLMPETGWYPVAIPTSNPDAPLLAYGDFTRFRLRVEAPKQKVVLSQGVARRQGDTLTFENPLAVEGLSVCGGDYRHYRMALKGLNLDFYYFPGHDVVSSLFRVLGEKEIQSVVKECLCVKDDDGFTVCLDSFEQCYGGFPWYDYPGGKTLRLVETPSSFSSCYRLASAKSEFVQPGLSFFNEWAYGLLPVVRMNQLKKKLERDVRKQAEENLVHAVLNGMKGEYLQVGTKNPFLKRLNLYGEETDGKSVWNLYSLDYLFRGKTMRLYSEVYPEADMMFRKLENHFFSTGTIVSTDLRHPESYFQTHGISAFFEDRNLTPSLRHELLSSVESKLFSHLTVGCEGEEAQLHSFMNDFYRTHEGKEVALETLGYEYRNATGKDLMACLRRWKTWNPTVFDVRDLSLLPLANDKEKVRLYLRAMNVGQDSGVLSVSYFTCGESDELLKLRKSYCFAPGEAKEIKIVDYMRMPQVDLGFSQNRPSILIPVSASGNAEAVQDLTSGCFPLSAEKFAEKSSDIVVDNRDKGFRLIEPKRKWLERTRKLPERSKYWEAEFDANVTHWTRYVSSSVYGDTIRDAYYKFHGNGQYKAEWTAVLPVAGKYEVFALLATSASYSFTVYHDGEQTEMPLNVGPYDWEDHFSLKTDGWRSLGQYYFPAGEARVVLDDRGKDNGLQIIPAIVADAVKWVKVDN